VGINFFRFVTKHAFDKYTDFRQMDRKLLAIPCIALNAVTW